MTFTTPALGILAADAPTGNMVVVVYETEGHGLKYAYIVPAHGRGKNVPLDDVSLFTPLSAFGVHATMTEDGHLAIHQLVPISTATYLHNGKPRAWQGPPTQKLSLIPRFGGYAVEAVRREFEARREAVRVAS